MLNLSLIYIYLILINKISYLDYTILIFCIVCFLVGLFDDIKNISSIKKLLIVGFAYLTTTLLNNEFTLNYVFSETLNKLYYLDSLKLIFSILCVLLLINALNLSDGINGLAIIISLIWMTYIYLYFENLDKSFLIIILTLIIMLPFNLKGKFFLGDSGSILIGSFISVIFITSYNLDTSEQKKSIEDIFILFMVPGIDMFRLFIERIKNKKNPFASDNNHIHHFLIKKNNLFKSLLIYSLLMLIPIIINSFNLIPSSMIIFSYVILYLIYINKLKKVTFYKNQKI